MRNYLFLFFFLIILTSCTNQSDSVPTARVGTSYPTGKPTQFSLGKCIDSREPTPNAKEKSLFPAITATDHVLGNNNAYVTILVYSDYQCVSCAQLAPLLKSFVEKFPTDVRVVFRNFPLASIHDKALIAAQASEAAALQGKFWEINELLFSRQAEWQNLPVADFQKWVVGQSGLLGLDKESFERDITSPGVVSVAQNAWADGQEIKLPGAPVILINNEIIKWQANLFDQLESYVRLALLRKKQFANCPPVVIDPTKSYIARLETSKGEVTIKLFVDKAPNTVNNFIFLAQNGWFDNIPFHRIVPGVLVQTGDPSGTGLGGPGYFIPSEKNTSLVYDRGGMVGMANSGPDTNGSQFFITLAPERNLNKDYPIFGEVLSGMNVLSQFTTHEPADNSPQSEVATLISITIEAK